MIRRRRRNTGSVARDRVTGLDRRCSVLGEVYTVKQLIALMENGKLNTGYRTLTRYCFDTLKTSDDIERREPVRVAYLYQWLLVVSATRCI